MLEDDFRFKGLRKKLVETLRIKGITDEAVLNAIGTVPRHFFFNTIGLYDRAYEDIAFPIAAGQTISQPYTVAFQSQLLEIKKREKVLEIGTGSGYQATILANLGARVYSIERQQELYTSTKELLGKMRTKADLFFGDGFKGLPQYGPFDKILLTAAPPILPDALIDQLKIGGYLVAPIGTADGQKMMRFVKESAENIRQEVYGNFAFVPMLKGTNT